MEFWMSNIQNDHLRSSKLSFAIDNLSSVVKLPTYHTPRVFWPTRCDKALSEVPCPNPRSETGAMSRCYDGWHRPSPIPATEAPHLKPGEEHKATTINDDQRRSTTINDELFTTNVSLRASKVMLMISLRTAGSGLHISLEMCRAKQKFINKYKQEPQVFNKEKCLRKKPWHRIRWTRSSPNAWAAARIGCPMPKTMRMQSTRQEWDKMGEALVIQALSF